MKSGFVGIIGRPNVGKSTLINSIVGKKVAITTSKPQTTRNIIQGIYNDDDTQIVFVDTPGIHKPSSKLGQTLNKQAYYSIEDTDIILFLIDASIELGKGDLFVIEKLKQVNKPVILVINKVDKISKEDIFKKITEYKDLYSFKDIVPLSALKNDNVKELIKVIKNYLVDEIEYYGKETITNKSMDFLISEMVREKVMDLTKQEVPHCITCQTKLIEYGKTSNNICIDIIVDRESLKKIIIGKQGRMIKQIGIMARKDIEKILNKTVYLELHVKTVKDWRNKEKYLNEYGFNDFQE